METIVLMFDYDSKIEDLVTREILQCEALAIKAAVGRTYDNIVEIGSCLTRAKEAAGHGNFLEWCEVEFKMSRQMAWQFMNVAERPLNVNQGLHLELPQRAIFALSAPSVSEETRALAIEKAASGEIKTARQVQTFVEERKQIEGLPAISQSSSTAPGFNINVAETQSYIQAKADKENQLRALATPEEALRFFLENETYLTGQPEFLSIWKRRARRAIQG